MKMRLTPPVAAQGAWLIAGRSAAGAVLVAVTVAACTGGGSSVPSIFTPTAPTGGHSSSTGAGTRTPSPTGQASRSSGSSSASATSTARGGVSTSGAPHSSSSSSASASSSAHASSSAPASSSAHASSSPTVTHTQAATTPAPTHSSAPVSTAYPTAAPETGGGGTAGLQDVTLFGVGGAAILAGFGSLAYRRRLTRKRRAEADARTSAPTHTTVH